MNPAAVPTPTMQMRIERMRGTVGLGTDKRAEQQQQPDNDDQSHRRELDSYGLLRPNAVHPRTILRPQPLLLPSRPQWAVDASPTATAHCSLVSTLFLVTGSNCDKFSRHSGRIETRTFDLGHDRRRSPSQIAPASPSNRRDGENPERIHPQPVGDGRGHDRHGDRHPVVRRRARDHERASRRSGRATPAPCRPG